MTFPSPADQTTPDTFRLQIAALAGRPLDADLRAGAASQWLCNREAGGIRSTVRRPSRGLAGLSMSELLLNYLGGRAQSRTGTGTALRAPVLGTELVRVDATGLDLSAGLAFAREQAGPAAVLSTLH